ncbi:M12 family metallo-peptidase [Solirubrobacter phytolaccae]|uniref:M12 family metallo-peptidase n=1 Tax=Solirubrobacter phytolaccae TaxID=1404360 RepID=A0A9X3SAE2_9ACTN|nr:M12 family metallo-peptidase [Solirubrobacter phytolaccae]MDA0180215.1 M12 family metallo-peptidase [Solirubrobacter phytolaccae]
MTAAAVAAAAPAAAHADVWEPITGKLSAKNAEVTPSSFKAFTLDTAGLKATLASAAKSRGAASATTILELPAPGGGTQRFKVHEYSIMEAGLAAKHPEIKTYAGHGLDDPTASVVADTTPQGFHASVRTQSGGWYVDPYYKGDDETYVSYFTRDAEDRAEAIAEIEPIGDAIKSSGTVASDLGPEIQLRTYRLALVTDPSYATYHGAANVTAAKVTLINRVNQIYETESAIRMILVADTDKLNLNTVAMATGANGPCGSAPCYTATNSCSPVLSRNRIAIGQIIGASAYDVGHIAMGNSGGGVANLGVIGGNNKAGGCTGLATPIGDYFAVDYVAHEIGHQFAGNHTFNGTQSNCGGNRSGQTSVEPGSGSSIMAYAGICQQDNLQPHSDPYWAPKSYEEILALVTRDSPPISEVQTVSLRDFSGTDSLTLTYDGKTVGPFVNGANYTAADIQAALAGQEVQAVRLVGYDTNGDSYRLVFKGVESHPIVRGQNNTAAGITNALVGGNEQQQVVLTGFLPTTGSFSLQVNGQTTPAFGLGGTAISNASVAAAINAILGATGTATITGAGNTGFTVTFAGGLAGTDVPSIAVVQGTGTYTSAVREAAKGGTGILGAGATVAVSTITDTGYTLLLGGTLAGIDVDALTIAGATGTEATVVETTKGGAGILGAGATATVTGFGGGTFDTTGFQVTFGGTLANLNLAPLTVAVEGGTGFVGETAKGGPIDNKGNTITPTGNHAPDVTVPGGYTIPPRTPFALTGAATDPDGDAVTYMWEQNDPAGIQGGSTAGTALVNQTKTNGVVFRQLGVGADISLEDSLKYHSPGLNLAGTNPTRTFPDMLQILADNTNARTGRCEGTVPPAPTALPIPLRECFSEWLPTTDYVGFLSDRSLTFRLTARDGKMAGGGLGFAQTKVTIAPLASPFRVTSQAVNQVIFGTTKQNVTWDVAGTDVAPINVANVKISLSTDGGLTYPTVLAASTPNDGSAEVTFPSVTATKVRIKVEAIGNVFFDVNHADFSLTAAPTAPVGGTVPATLSLTLGAPATFPSFVPGVAREYTATTEATVLSTAGDATLTVADPSTNATGHLVNGAFSLPQPLQGLGVVKTWTAPTSNEKVPVTFKQQINANDPLRTGTYSKTLTFTLSTTNP